MKRNYMPREKNPLYEPYHDWVDRLMIKSQVFNSGSMHPGLTTVLWDRQAIENQLIVLEGNKQGVYYKRGEEACIALIPFAKMRLKELNNSFKDYQKEFASTGKKAPTEWPKHLFKDRLEFEARLLVLEAEAEELKKKLEKYTDDDLKLSDKNVLKDGPKGFGRMRNGQLAELDGMRVSVSEEGILFIDDNRAPLFDGYSTADYYEFIVKPWAIARKQLAKETREKIDTGKLRMDKVKKGLRDGSSAPWPTMPEECKKYNVVEINSEDEEE